MDRIKRCEPQPTIGQPPLKVTIVKPGPIASTMMYFAMARWHGFAFGTLLGILLAVLAMLLGRWS